MGFKEVKPLRNNSSINREKNVRVSFSKIKATGTFNLNIYIGKTVAQEYGFKSGDKIKFYVDEDNPRIWLLKKSTDGIGYSLIDATKDKEGSVLRLQMGWRDKQFVPKDAERALREVEYGVYEGGLRIFGTL